MLAGRVWMFVFLGLTFVSQSVAQRPDPNSPRYKAVQAIRGFVENDQATAEDFAIQHMVATAMQGDARFETLQQLSAIKKALGGHAVDTVEVRGPYDIEIGFSDSMNLKVKLQSNPPHKIKTINLDVENQPASSFPELTWENLDERLAREAEDGWAGAIMIVRDGEVIVNQAFGFAHAENRIENSPTTIFAIGSTPIDFTNAAIMQLVEQGKLKLTDPITEFFNDVPNDKQAITIDHLMTGRSGLQNFHDLPGDANPDHTYIDRDEAMRRIFDQQLLFEPGQGRAHSHSAFGVLAAIVEIVSGQTYEQYTIENLFKPLGMNDTGFFGQPLPEQRTAVGDGQRSEGEINAPPYWGKTSWLVMGSGGQVSTVADMNRWIAALHAGKVVSDEHVRKITGSFSGLAVGGDMFGFEIFYSQHPESRFILTSNNVNSRQRRTRMNQFARELHQLITPRNRYSLGIEMNIDSDVGVSIQRVISGSAAEKFGLKSGDRLISANGQSLLPDPMAVLDPLLASGDPITFKIERGNKQITVNVRPSLRK